LRKKKDELTSDELNEGRDDIAEVEAVNTMKQDIKRKLDSIKDSMFFHGAEGILTRMRHFCFYPRN